MALVCSKFLPGARPPASDPQALSSPQRWPQPAFPPHLLPWEQEVRRVEMLSLWCLGWALKPGVWGQLPVAAFYEIAGPVPKCKQQDEKGDTGCETTGRRCV